MIKTLRTLFIAAGLCVSTAAFSMVELAGVKVEDSVTIAGAKLQLNGAGIHQLDIAQNVKNGDAKSGFDFEKGQVSFNTRDGDGIGFSVFHLFSNFVTGLILSQIRPN